VLGFIQISDFILEVGPKQLNGLQLGPVVELSKGWVYVGPNRFTSVLAELLSSAGTYL